MSNYSKQIGSVTEVRHPLTKKIVKEVWLKEKGLYRKNTTYKVYNSVDNYEQLKLSDLPDIIWDKCK